VELRYSPLGRGEITWREVLEGVCRKLLERDPDIVEIVRFGSSVYAPDLSGDVDLLVVSMNPKSYDVYLDAIAEVDPPFNVDIVVVKPGQELGEELVRGVLGAFEVLYGDGRHVLSYARSLGDPAFEEARAALRAAREYLELTLRAGDKLLRDRHAREAFDTLFHAARTAAMTYLSTHVARWGLSGRMLPEPYNAVLGELINVLHVKYFYNGEYPKENIEEEFNILHEKVERFINDLERELVKRQKGSIEHRDLHTLDSPA